MHERGRQRQHGKPCGAAVRTATRRSARSRAGHRGVAEGRVVPTKPGNAGGGKAPWFKTDAASGEEPEIGKPDNSTKRSEAAERVACQSEGRTRLSVLPAVRQGVSGRRAGVRLPMLQGQQGGSGSRRPAVRRHRSVRGGPVARGIDEQAEGKDLRAASGQAGLDTQAEQQEDAPAGNSHGHRPGGTDGGATGARSDLRSGFGAGAIRLPERSRGA